MFLLCLGGSATKRGSLTFLDCAHLLAQDKTTDYARVIRLRGTQVPHNKIASPGWRANRCLEQNQKTSDKWIEQSSSPRSSSLRLLLRWNQRQIAQWFPRLLLQDFFINGFNLSQMALNTFFYSAPMSWDVELVLGKVLLIRSIDVH